MAQSAKRPGMPKFDPFAPDDVPEASIASAIEAGPPLLGDKMLIGEITPGVDLSAGPRIVLLVGRGRTGKTLTARWMADRAMSASPARDVLLGDFDPGNATFKKWFEDAVRPKDVLDGPGTTWMLDRLVRHAASSGTSAVIDMGAGDTALARLVRDQPDLMESVETSGAAIVLLQFLSPDEEDLGPILNLQALEFQPKARALILNTGSSDFGAPPTVAFAGVQRHSIYRSAIERGAIPVWMPRMPADVMKKLIAYEIHFSDAATHPKLTSLDRSLVRVWCEMMERQWGGVASWLV